MMPLRNRAVAEQGRAEQSGGRALTQLRITVADRAGPFQHVCPPLNEKT
jgi:hypothetical protein